ncbi:MAG: TIGR00730 family Rossman fold protein [Phycisphaerales bacterium]|nr:TIGR00730 family Rossman fold protein [Phycisphaerales bacterium]
MRQPLTSVCVFCGSSTGNDPRYVEAARALGAMIARSRLTLVYGGGAAGLMGAVADAALENDGDVIGVIPHSLRESESAHSRVANLHVVSTMHERKAKMADLADAFVSLPGGLGTLDETFEILTWAQLGIHHKPVAMWNVAGFFDPLVAYLDHAVECGLIRPQHRALLIVESGLDRLFERLRDFTPPPLPRWSVPDDR